MTNIKFNCHLPSARSLFCLKASAVKDAENAKEESHGATSASPSKNKMPGNRSPAWLNKSVGKADSPKKEPDFHFQWEEGSLLVSPEHGDALLRNLRLDKENFAKGKMGEISIFENESGDRIAGKFPLPQGMNKVDEITRELEVYKTIYQKKEVGRHPNLLNVYGIANKFDKNGNLKRALLMEAIPGPTGWDAFRALRKCWDAGKISSNEYWGAIQFIGRRLLDVTKHISKAGVVHGDIKPENFLVNKETGEPVLIDFGSAGWGEEHVRGITVPYAPPEYRNGDVENIGERSDVFSIGASLFHGIEPEATQTPMYGLIDQRKYAEDDEGNPIERKPGTPGTYSVTTAYTNFMDQILEKDVSSRVDSDAAKKLEFLNDSILDDDAAKAVITNAINEANKLAGMEEKKSGGNARDLDGA